MVPIIPINYNRNSKTSRAEALWNRTAQETSSPPSSFSRDVTRHGTAITRLHLTPILLLVITVPKVLLFYTQAASYSITFRLQRYAPTAFGFWL
jgi:hypothetical protein